MSASEVYVNWANPETNQIEIEELGSFGKTEQITVSDEVIQDAQLALRREEDQPVIMMFDQDTKTFIHEQLFE